MRTKPKAGSPTQSHSHLVNIKPPQVTFLHVRASPKLTASYALSEIAGSITGLVSFPAVRCPAVSAVGRPYGAEVGEGQGAVAVGGRG